MRYSFEWNLKKAKENKRKHKISFERGAQIFLDPFQIAIFDDEHSSEEERWITIGMDGQEVLLVIVHTFNEISNDECHIRVISARKATKKEIRQYRKFP